MAMTDAAARFSATPPPDKAAAFRRLLTSPDLQFLCEAHNGLSARIAEDAGFLGLWASGLSISASLGVRDNNEASWTQVLEVVEFMADATRVPIMLDGDTGYGNFNNMRRLVQKLESRGIAAVCIEDKLFPKTNSFLHGEAQVLADVDEFCGKIRAGKAAQSNPDFSIVARVEALIAGRGLDEALRRAGAYHAAGADAILIHSASSTADEVVAFLDAWNGCCPVVLVPTKYYTTPTEVFREHRASLVIWANHLVRASIAAMQQTAATLYADQSLLSIENAVAPISEVFRLQGAAELEEAERLYLPHGDGRAVVLAAARGQELGELTAELPKAMLDVAGKPLLAHIVATYRSTGISDITVVRGYGKDRVALPGLALVDNDAFAETAEVASLACAMAADADGGPLVVSYGDVLFRRHLLDMLADALAAADDDTLAAIAVDTAWQESRNRGHGRRPDFVTGSRPYDRSATIDKVTLQAMGCELGGRIDGEWMGLVRFSASGARHLAEMLLAWQAEDGQGLAKAHMNQRFNRLVAEGNSICVVYTTGHWLDVNHVEDLVLAGSFV
jgi:phosphoenolpyruvate phosphomutase